MNELLLLYFTLGAFDAWLTQRRIRDYGSSVELNSAIRYLATTLGPQAASVIGVMLPVTAISFLTWFFNVPILLALLVGFNIKRFEIQLASLEFEKTAKNIKEQINAYHKLHGSEEATLPSDSNESKSEPPSSKDDNALTK